MKTINKKTPGIQRIMVYVFVLIISGKCGMIAGQGVPVDSVQPEYHNYLATSVFILSSFIPNDDTYFFELDYGYKIRENMDLVIGLNTYKYAAPMSTPISDNTRYPGTVTSYGIVTAFQYYFLGNFFIDQMINPLVLDYHPFQDTRSKPGFMLLLATRLGYHHDFSMFNYPFFIEIGAEASYWPVNSGIPESYKTIDDDYKMIAFSPAFQFGLKF